ncbi:N-acetylneuraminate synthase family protein [Chromobacterium haemolyticum]|uniref:N-acetylneuraminate synthase family protein n=1 Tax=Chromobacterium haemolyticum TaxID=394935 RepID=UPI004056E115
MDNEKAVAAMRQIGIGGRLIGDGQAPFTIAEVGINHNGDVDLALQLIETAAKAGADAVKFQTFKAVEFCGDPEQQYTYRSQGREVTESMLAMFQRHELPRAAWFRLKAKCDELGILFLSTPQNRGDLDLLMEVGVPAIKIGSDDFSNLPLIRHYRQAGVPLIMSCGMSDLSEVHQALEAAGWFNGHPVVVLLCTSQYPTPPEDVHLRKLMTLRQAFDGLLLGFSDHTQGPLASSLARGLGACVFEKHFTLSHDFPGPDHWFSEEPADLGEWVAHIHAADKMLGSPWVRPTEAEREMRELARRSVVALRRIAPGETLTLENIGLRRPGGGLPPECLDRVLGLNASVALQQGQRLEWGDMVKARQA